MSRKIYIKQDSACDDCDPFREEMDETEKYPLKYGLVEFSDKIFKMEDEEPKDKRSKEYKKWKKDLINMYILYNELVGFKCFNHIF